MPTSENLIMGLVKLTKDESKQVPVYTAKGVFNYEAVTGLTPLGKIPDEYRKWGFNANNWAQWLAKGLEKDFEENLFKLVYRSVRGEKLEQILSTGSDIPGQVIGDKTYATIYLDKAIEYGYDRKQGLLQQNVCVSIYDTSSMQINHQNYDAFFLKEPINALKGVLVIKPE